MREPSAPANPPANPPDSSSFSDDPLVSRLDAYLSELDAAAVPPSLLHTTLADVRTAHGRSLMGSPRGMAFAGVAASLVLLLGVFAFRRGGPDPSSTNLGVGASSSSTTAGEVVSPTSACCNTSPGTDTPGTTGDTQSPTTADPSGTSSSTTIFGSSQSTPSTTVAGNTNSSTTTPGSPTTKATTTIPTTTPTTITPTTPSTVPSGDLFFDDFSSYTPGTFPNANGWSKASGTASVITTQSTQRFLRNDTPSNAEGRASAGASNWASYAVSATIKMEPNVRVAGLAARFQDAGNYLYCKMSFNYGGAGSNKLWLGVNDNAIPSLITPAMDVSWSAGQLYVMTLTVVGNNATCTVDGVGTLSGSSSRFPTGKIATVADGAAGFTNVRVQAR